MKKALLIGLALGLFAAWAVPAVAVDLTASGYIGTAGYVFKNASAAPPFAGPGIPFVTNYPNNRNNSPITAYATNNNAMGSFINSRAELQFTVRASEDLYGVFKFRMNGSPNPWGAARGGTIYSVEGGGNIAVDVEEIFVDFRVPPKLPIWIRVGQQPIFIRGWIFMFEEDPGVSVRVNIDPIKLSITGYYAKLLDPSNIIASGGAEFYAVDTKIPLTFGSVNIAPGVFFALQNNRYDNAFGVDPDAQQLWWLGVNADGKIGPVNMQVDFIYNGGTLYNAAIADTTYNSWLVSGSLSYVMKKLEVGVGGKFVTGDDTDTTDIETFQLPGTGNYGSESMAISGDFIVFDNGWMSPGPGWPGVGLIDGPSTFWFGYWDVRAFAYYQVLDWLKVGAQLGYIGDTVHGSAIGGVGADAIGNDAEDDNNIGWEMDFGVNVNIYKNLSLQTGFGYLFAGKALSTAGGFAPQDPWALKSRLMYMF